MSARRMTDVLIHVALRMCIDLSRFAAIDSSPSSLTPPPRETSSLLRLCTCDSSGLRSPTGPIATLRMHDPARARCSPWSHHLPPICAVDVPAAAKMQAELHLPALLRKCETTQCGERAVSDMAPFLLNLSQVTLSFRAGRWSLGGAADGSRRARALAPNYSWVLVGSQWPALCLRYLSTQRKQPSTRSF
jgi:hypothetical protein